ncbi:MAG TPA: response regulator transcription factor [Blastocatellia bacterium]|nr:response regulator transcription factor [Blastocatellia bacterium]
MDKIRVFLAEDHATVREGLKMLVNSQPDMEVIGEAGDGSSTVSQAEQLRPDVVVMDVSMPGLNGLKATEALKQACPQIRILALTRHSDGGYLQQLLAAGATGYVLKQSVAAELLRAIRILSAGGGYLDPGITGKVMNTIVGRQPKSGVQTQAALSSREAEVLRLIALGYSNKEIAEELRISVKTVEAHKANSMKKLGITSRIGIVRYAILQGWMVDL